MQILNGMNSVAGITDLWWSPLMSDKWAPLVTSMDFCPHPFEMILPGANAPRHLHLARVRFPEQLEHLHWLFCGVERVRLLDEACLRFGRGLNFRRSRCLSCACEQQVIRSVRVSVSVWR